MWIAAGCLGSGLSGLWLSYHYKMPIIAAWSTPGAVLLMVALPHYSLQEAIAAFIVSALLIVICGVTGIFARLMEKIPQSLSAAMLAGILVSFGFKIFANIDGITSLPLIMFVVWLIAKRFVPSFSLLLVLIAGMIYCYFTHELDFSAFHLSRISLTPIMPHFSVAAIIGVAIPLFIVTMTSQNLPGVVVLRTSGYEPPVSACITTTGGINLLLAPFGALGVNLAAITAAIATSESAHADAQKRYTAGIWSGIFYCIVALFAGGIVALFAAFPPAFVAALAGIALIPTITGSLTLALKQDETREAAMITFLTTASNMQLFGIGSAFWGIILGGILLFLRRFK